MPNCPYCDADRPTACRTINAALACEHFPGGEYRETFVELQRQIDAGYVADLGDGQFKKIKEGFAPEAAPFDPDAEKLRAEFTGDFRRAYPGKFTSADVIAFAKSRPGSAMHSALIVNGGATDAERVRNFERVVAEVFGKPNPGRRA